MTESEKILRKNMTEISGWDNRPMKAKDDLINHALIPYTDALKAMEEVSSDVDFEKIRDRLVINGLIVILEQDTSGKIISLKATR
tara:strand:+ start:269 stop:523 length:255 start_codon:yes stop_codon:yes gene_type:complete